MSKIGPQTQFKLQKLFVVLFCLLFVVFFFIQFCRGAVHASDSLTNGLLRATFYAYTCSEQITKQKVLEKGVLSVSSNRTEF